MKKNLFPLVAFFLAFSGFSQKVDFEEYDLKNGLHVILHKDDTAPKIITSIMYHVGAKNEQPDRTGFAHFFEHLLFEGTKNIKRGEWDKIVSSNGGTGNANTSDDRTYYYEIFPSNGLELSLWMESERMLHPVINQIGVDTQNEVVKEEKRARIDNQPYSRFIEYVKKHLFKKHPYRNTTIGKIAHLDAATLEEFKAFHKKFYVPNNATLVVAGDFDTAKAKEYIETYFGRIPRGAEINRDFAKEEPITAEIKAKGYDPNIQLPATLLAYRTPSLKSREAMVLDLISSYLSVGQSSVFYKKMVDQKKIAINVGSFNNSQEDYGSYIIYALPLGNVPLEVLNKNIDEEIEKLQTQLISEKDLQKLQNIIENDYVNANSSIVGIAESLATFYTMHNGNTNLINTRIETYKSITREEIREVAKKYLNKNQRLVLEYLAK